MSSSSKEVLVPVAAPASQTTVGGASTVVPSMVDTGSTGIPLGSVRRRTEGEGYEVWTGEQWLDVGLDVGWGAGAPKSLKLSGVTGPYKVGEHSEAWYDHSTQRWVTVPSPPLTESIPQWKVEQSALDALNAQRARFRLDAVTQDEAKNALMGGWAKYVAAAEAPGPLVPGGASELVGTKIWIDEAGVIKEGVLQRVTTMPAPVLPVAKPKEPKKPHPLSIPAIRERSGALGMKAGDHVKHDPDGKTGRADEFLSDGDCLITWDDGTYGCVKWNNLSPSPLPPEAEPPPEPESKPESDQSALQKLMTDYEKGLADGLKAASGAPTGVKQALLHRVQEISGKYAAGFEEGVRRSA